MNFPDPKSFGKALGLWRKHESNLTEQQVAENSARKDLGKKPFSSQTVKKWEKGGFKADFSRVAADVFPAYGIGDVDLFLDYCRTSKLEDVKVIREEELHLNTTRFGVQVRFAGLNLLRPNRTRIDKLVVPRGRESKWSQHEGHEYLLVFKGKLECEFAEEQNGHRQHETLESGDAIAFPSTLYHRIWNEKSSEEDAEVLVGRPAWSPPSGEPEEI